METNYVVILDFSTATVIKIHLSKEQIEESYKYTRVRDKKRLEKVGNLVKNSYLYR